MRSVKIDELCAKMLFALFALKMPLPIGHICPPPKPPIGEQNGEAVSYWWIPWPGGNKSYLAASVW